jgi:hypothetical protein
VVERVLRDRFEFPEEIEAELFVCHVCVARVATCFVVYAVWLLCVVRAKMALGSPLLSLDKVGKSRTIKREEYPKAPLAGSFL